jgi:ABC-type sugar transport system substrate-binding protein
MRTSASRSRRLVVALALAALAASAAGCVAYPVAVVPPPADKYDRVWDSALRAADDVGIQVAGAEKSSGYISGAKGAINAQIFVLRQADGSVRVQLDLKGPLEQDPGLADRFSRAYERYMGR